MDQFLTAPRAIVDDVLDAVAALQPLLRSDPASGTRIVLQAERDPAQVAVLSGGGAGHEPAHAGFVGPGMLSGAIAGDLFASPGVEAVLAAIRACADAPGVLLVIKNYTGDRLNFGLAAERARAEGIALPDAAQPRGIAGTVLVHKYVGHLAREGVGLAELAQRGQAFAGRLLSLGMALSSCTVPGQHAGRRAPELGLGIHNEPGTRKVQPASVEDALALVLDPLLTQADARYGAAAPLVLLLNDLGGCSTQELGVLTRLALQRIGSERIALMTLPAALMTSMDMHGFSITLAPADADVLAALRSPVQTLGWPGVRVPHAPVHFAPALSRSDAFRHGARDAQRAAALARVTQALIGAQSALDALDAQTGDGDAGSTFAAGARALQQALQQDALATGAAAPLAHGLAATIERSMGGSSGVLLSILFTTAATELEAGHGWVPALQAGVARMQHYGGAQLGDRTMLDALLPALHALARGGSADDAARAARAGADATAQLTQARAGRSAAVPADALRGVADPGADAVARAFAAWRG
ncbi:dihydroxyacetone kinase subunit DhaK [Xanthomonas graminis]|uniref:Glycerol kinase n=3 Tax=Xanthomonas translucens group TaxID=3390202 RepID=A0A1M4L8K6_9XANT|nr:dihydroxyacetone kinase subunit DhaK [Xanthomonas translucens]OAX60142.1 glycerol kinase [Xanthomonas translucens pv. graminis]UKE54414.1 dihydroxyacetone kinase subunit DhaK [Xanthomonas translucens pv. graminis]WIH12321.1 dihydroxyacetone kinase subunit DhaK [Xanthomonas translucens pv. graminis]WIH15991.1 dihydroxyacetone kinase subunit DhaK [Xanthomonas translucens pv. graminis]SBV48818.1 glycerol kinase [Xanthomonas translucens pv. graminis ART-Xtg29]